MKKIKSVFSNKKLLWLLVGVIVFALWWGCCSSCKTIGVIDFSVVQKEAKLYQSVINERKKYEEQIRIRIVAEYGDLEKEVSALEKQKGSMKVDEYQKKFSALQRKVMAVQEKYNPAWERIEAATQIALRNGAGKYLDEAFQKTAKQNGVKILISKTSTLYSDKKMDVTDAFVKNLDELVQSVPYPDPAKLGG